LSVEKAKEAVSAGAQFIVSPGFNPKVVQWCVEQNIPITPGCVTPSEIEQALSYGLKVLKFFPADVYGGVKACKALNGPYGHVGVKFIPTGGVNNDNLAEYADKPFIHAIGGGWLCSTENITNHRFENITETAKKAVDILLGFEFAHMGINGENEEESLQIVKKFEAAFKLTPKYGNSSNFAGPEIEVTKNTGLGKFGHIAIRTNNIQRAVHYLKKRGFEAVEDTAKYKGDKMIAIFLKEEIGNFAIHLLQK
jgi:2-dehydro-3-deoxyphosphogluconate aldolase/(4S)-4-hydroxy-2-oxoglutarate aldolase